MQAMKSLIFCLTLLCGMVVLVAQAPQWQWAVGAGGTFSDGGWSIAIDSQGNQYITGNFRNTATFGSHSLTSNGIADIFAAKLDPNGNWLWAVQAGGTDSDFGNEIALDSNGNAYVTGEFGGTATFGSHTLTASRGIDFFIAKLNSDGNWLWAVKAGGIYSGKGSGIAVDGSGNAWVTGYFKGTATFGNHTLTSEGVASRDIFVARLSSSGNWLWVVQAGGIDGDEGYGIALDDSGYAYVTGHFTNTATFGSHTLTASGSDRSDVFVSKLSSSGNWLWAVKAGGETGFDKGYNIAADASGNTWVTGEFFGTATFGSNTLTSSGSIDIFVAKLNSDGNWLWAVQAGGGGIDRGYDIAVDGSGNAFVTGLFQSTATFGSHQLVHSGDTDIFAAKLDSSGNWLWAVKAGGSNTDGGSGIAVDGAENAYVNGYFRNTAAFGNHHLTSSGSFDIFVAKLENLTPVEDELASPAVSKLHSAYPNPLHRGGSALIKAEIPERSTGILSIFNLRGQIVASHKLGSGSQQLSFSGEGLPAGVYLYNLQCGDYKETRKLVLLK